MLTLVFTLFAVAALVAMILVVRTYGGTLRRFRGDRIVVCPENDAFVAVQVDARHAAGTALGGRRELRLKDCSRWPEQQSCGQECLAQIEAAPMDCLARTLLVRWYEDARCAVCNKMIGAIDWTKHKPGLMSPDRRTLAWSEVPAASLPEVLHTHWPVCWDCHVIETLVREHPDRVTVRPPHRSPGIPGPMPPDPQVRDASGV